jgi:serine/threonine protein kinase/Flp pilus assembly protein TadD
MTDRVPTEAEPAADESLGRLLDELTARLQAGEPIDLAEEARRHPHHADALRALFPALAAIRALSESPEADRAVPPAVPGGVAGVLGDFRIVREVGRGGMGVVYEAEQLSLGRRVALKVLPFAAVVDPRHLQRFQNEARAAAALDHPHVVKIHAVGCDRGVHFIAMQFVDGRTLAELIAERRPKPAPAGSADPTVTHGAPAPAPAAETRAAARAPTERVRSDAGFCRRAAEWAAQAADGLEHAHGLGVVHRDVKPSNLLVDGRGQVYVADFGLAKLATDPGVTGTGDLLGTVRYMSPEQADAKHDLVDHRSDVYSLGVTLYELLTLTPAFDGADRRAILSKVTGSDPVAPRRLERAVPRDLETVVLKAMDKDPARRYQAARDLADDLRRFLNNEPVRARPATLAQRARKWGRRHPAAVTSAVLALALLAAGSSLSTWLVWREKGRTAQALTAVTDERNRANAEMRIARERDAETTAVLGFVEDTIFAAARPEGRAGGLGHEVKLRQALEAALPLVAKKFPDQPLTEARLRRTLGLSFRYLGDEATAAAQFEAARALYAKHLGPDHPNTLTAANNLANSYAALGRREDALRLREDTLARRRAVLESGHPDTLASMSNLANSYDAAGRYEDALRLREAVLELRREKFRADDPDTLMVMNNLGVSYTTLGRHEDALKLREETLALAEARFGRGHINTLPHLHNLAETYAALGRPADAVRLYEETLDLAKVKLPAGHANTLLVMNNLAWVLATASDARVRDPARAVELAATAARLAPKRADFRGTLGTARYRAGDWEQATRDLEKAIDLRGPDDPVNANEGFFLAMARWRLGDGAGARRWFEKGAAWMDRARTRGDEVRRFRAEAAALLGVADDDPRPDQPPR